MCMLIPCRPCSIPVPIPPQPTTTEAFGRMFNQSALSVQLDTAPLALPLESSADVKNVSFTPGSFRITVPGTYWISYSITASLDFSTMDAAQEVDAPTADVSAMAAVIPYNTYNMAAVLLNGVELPSSYSYLFDYPEMGYTLQKDTLIALPENTVVSLGLWNVQDGCSCRTQLYPNTQLTLTRIGAVA